MGMTGASRVIVLCAAGAVFGVLLVVFSPLAEANDIAGAAHGAFAGALFGGAIAILPQTRPLRAGGGFLAPALLLANPLACFAFLRGAETALLFAAAIIVAGGGVALAGLRDHRAAIFLGLALALAPFVSGPVLYLYPGLALTLPLFSPWGPAPRKAAGFAVVVWSPSIMVLAGLLYLRWLLAPAGGADAAAIAFDIPFGREAVAAAAGAGFVALAAFAASRRAAALAFLAGGFLLARLFPFWNGGF